MIGPLTRTLCLTALASFVCGSRLSAQEDCFDCWYDDEFNEHALGWIQAFPWVGWQADWAGYHRIPKPGTCIMFHYTCVEWDADGDMAPVELETLAQSITAASGPELLKLLFEVPGLRFNFERKAVQLRSCEDGKVAMHVPLQSSQVAALNTARSDFLEAAR